MVTDPLTQAIHSLRRAALRDGAGLSDTQLLNLFVDQRDDAAFAGLVHRHGPLVWGVCRRIVANHHDSEDAFQATFLVLARKAVSIKPRALVANWLYGVACRIALKVRVTARKRYAREKQVRTMPEPQSVPRSRGVIWSPSSIRSF